MTLRVSVVVASLGRPENLGALLSRLAQQTQTPERVILSMESEVDAPPAVDYPFPVEQIFGPCGSSVQRNRGLDMLGPETDVVIFYDDDFVPSRFAIERLAEFFAHHPEVAGATGYVVKDGINGPGIPSGEAARIVAAYDEAEAPADFRITGKTHGLYGCNMAYQMSMIKGIRFDENLPLYAWFEDLDFGGQITTGPLVKTRAFAGVHCGEKRGREKNGRKVGYSQVANPIYMARKGTLSWKIVQRSIPRLMSKNLVRILRPEPWIDRTGRATGNWIGIWDLLRGRLDPNRILEF